METSRLVPIAGTSSNAANGTSGDQVSHKLNPFAITATSTVEEPTRIDPLSSNVDVLSIRNSDATSPMTQLERKIAVRTARRGDAYQNYGFVEAVVNSKIQHLTSSD